MRKTILIADDSELNRSILEEFFCEQYDTLLAEDGEQAIQILTEQEQQIALVLLDLVMPGKNGFEVLQFMKNYQLDSRIPVIVITGSTDYQDELKSYNMGASDIIHKPFVPEIVLRRAENVMELFTRRAAIEDELERRTRELEAARTYDLLTGLYNMQYFLTRAAEMLRKADEEGKWADYAFVYGNLRNFKFHNLKNGVEDGNRVLKLLAAKISEISPPGSIHSRFGNDHIVSMIPTKDSAALAEKLCEMFDQEFGNTSLKLKIGIYRVTARGENVAAACDFAKVACDTIYESKERICVYSDQIARQISISNYVVEHLDEAIANGYIKVYYQPVIRTISGALCGMEALARWIDPVMGFLSPADFISVLERQHLITKLDLHMLRLICKEMKEAEEKNLKLIPVSFNLSRMDLLECDIFHEVESIRKEYSVPRDFINIEITESTITERPDYMRQIIGSFRNAGYQVWMDDFGSEYSSLNSLKDYQFDEIKLDMKFLSKFDDTCKKIIKSVIRMAKDLGIQTLAEGVETEAQLEFLREVGCEKAQGYYFSKPEPVDVLLENMIKSGERVEERGWRSYYNSIGEVNFITDRSLAVVEFDGKNFAYRFVNEAYRKVWEGIGTTDIDIITRVTNSRTGSLGKQLRDLQKTLHKGDGPRDIFSPTRGKYIRLTIQCLAEYRNSSCYAVEISNLSSREDEQKQQQFDKVFRDMYGLYDAIYLYDLRTKRFRTLMHASSNQAAEYQQFHSTDRLDVELAAKIFIHPTEKEEFEAFLDLRTLRERLKASDRGYLAHYFRSTNGQGAYTWAIHTMLYVPAGNYVIYCVRAAFFNQEGLLEKLAPEYLADAFQANGKNIHHVFRQAVMESKTVSIFWKDKERRFINVNEKFLATYGFVDASAVIGRTDEEMGWHVDNAPFRDDELDVLEHGKIIRNRVGKCIIQGVDHTIIANKEPMYENGEIVGLLGSFIVADDVEGVDELIRPQTIDTATRLMSGAGLTDEVSRFIENWRGRQENFAVIRITLSEYFRIGRTYGERVAREMLYEVGRLLAGTVDVHGTCARLFGGNFSILMKCSDDKEIVRQICDTIVEKLTAIHQLQGCPVTFNPQIEIRFADEVEDLKSIIGIATGGTVVDVAERKLLEEKLNNYDIQFNTVVNVLNEALVGVIVHATERDEMLYENQVARELVDTCFDGSMEILQKEVIAAMRRENLVPSERAGEFQVECRGRQLRIRISDQIWDGCSAKVIYLMNVAEVKT